MNVLLSIVVIKKVNYINATSGMMGLYGKQSQVKSPSFFFHGHLSMGCRFSQLFLNGFSLRPHLTYHPAYMSYCKNM